MTAKKKMTEEQEAEMQKQLEIVRDICGEIHKHEKGDLPSLIAALKSEYKLKFAKVGGMLKANMLGLKGAPAQSERLALVNWSNAARRELKNVAA